MAWPNRIHDPGSNGVLPLALALVGMMPWFGLMMWANWRCTGGLVMTNDDREKLGIEENLLVALPVLFGGWAVAGLSAFYGVAWIFSALGLPPEGGTFDLWFGFALGNAGGIPPAVYHLWSTRHFWRDGGAYKRERAKGAW